MCSLRCTKTHVRKERNANYLLQVPSINDIAVIVLTEILSEVQRSCYFLVCFHVKNTQSLDMLNPLEISINILSYYTSSHVGVCFECCIALTNICTRICTRIQDVCDLNSYTRCVWSKLVYKMCVILTRLQDVCDLNSYTRCVWS